MKYFIGTSGEQQHDAAFTVVDEKGDIKFASLSERFTGVKHDYNMPTSIFEERIAPYKNSDTEYWLNDNWCLRARMRPGMEEELMREFAIKKQGAGKMVKLDSIADGHPYYRLMFHPQQKGCNHHESHAAAAFMTRPKSFAKEDCVMVVIDGIGEWRSGLILNSDFEVVHDMCFPKSLGYLYATFTNRVPPLTANEDEYVIMGKSCYGEPTHWKELYEMFNCVPEFDMYSVEEDLEAFDWDNRYSLKTVFLNKMCDMLFKECANVEDAAASLQRMTEECIIDFMKVARKHGSKLCYSGGVAQNIMANSRIHDMFDDVWIDVNPGDGGAALGAAAFGYYKATGNDRINWEHPYLGHVIEGTVDPEEVVDYIMKNKVAGIANGGAEYSCRAYGNRSLIADVRYDVKDTVNEIKRRQKFRPFAPAILEEHAHMYFDGPMNRWMQFVAKAKHDYSSVTHVDGTGRVQLVPSSSHSVFRQILEVYYEKTGIPMLLNTSLNIRRKPMVNDYEQAMEFQERYGGKVFTGS